MNKINQFLDNFSKHSLLILRLSLGIVFIYFGWTSITTPDMWSGYVPYWTSFIAQAEPLVRIHGVVEIGLGLLLVMGIQTRIVALILFFDLLHIITLLEFGSVWMRDLGLAGSLLSLGLMKEKEEIL